MIARTPAILATEGADNAPGRPTYTCRGCPRRLCRAGYCTPQCRSAHARRTRNLTANLKRAS